MHWGSRVARLGPGTATIVRDDGGGATEVPCDWVLAMTGWRPDRTLLHSLGVHTDPRTGIPDHGGPRHHGDERAGRLHRRRDRGRVQREQDLHRERARAWGVDRNGLPRKGDLLISTRNSSRIAIGLAIVAAACADPPVDLPNSSPFPYNVQLGMTFQNLRLARPGIWLEPDSGWVLEEHPRGRFQYEFTGTRWPPAPAVEADLRPPGRR